MSDVTSLDIRVPIGGTFGVLGLMLAVYGAVARPQTSAGININLWWGIVMLVFGIALFAFGWSATRSRGP
jgi:uncharacterized membrane protein HdeD (DUF308 family)